MAHRVGIKADNHPWRSSARASRMISGSRSNFPNRRSCSASAASSRQSRSFSTINKTLWSTSRLSSSMASTRWMISGRSFFGSNTVEFTPVICRPCAGRASPLLRTLPETQQNSPVDALLQVWQGGAAMNEREKRFSFTRAASSTRGRAKKQVFISSATNGVPQVHMGNPSSADSNAFVGRNVSEDGGNA